jgi:transcriptional regulator with XRE-family HTH domain
MEQTVNLKRFRQKFGITQDAAARTIGIDQRQWNRYENGINELPVRYLKEICIKFNVSADWILEIGGEVNTNEPNP